MIVMHDLRALVVDDNSYARTITAMGLKKLGIGHVEEAESGAEALLRLMHERFDFMVMDWFMPEISGAGLMRVLRADSFGVARDMPVIMMTAYASHDSLGEARLIGVNDILTKPFTGEQLGAAVGRILAPAPASRAVADDGTFVI